MPFIIKFDKLLETRKPISTGMKIKWFILSLLLIFSIFEFVFSGSPENFLILTLPFAVIIFIAFLMSKFLPSLEFEQAKKIYELATKEPNIIYEANETGIRFHIAFVAFDKIRPILKFPDNPIIEIPYGDIIEYKRSFQNITPSYGPPTGNYKIIHTIDLAQDSKLRSIFWDKITLNGDVLENQAQMPPEKFQENLIAASHNKLKLYFSLIKPA